MNQTDNQPNQTAGLSVSGIDVSCRVPLLALFGGAALWLVLGLLLDLAAAMSFHAPDIFANCACLTYGHAQPAANDLLVYGFAIPAALGVTLWIFARLSDAPLALPIVPVVAANLWHLGVLLGTVGILTGNSTGYLWLEYPRPAAVLLFTGFMLIAVSGAATMGFRRERAMHPAHWFLFAGLLWFAWTYSSANLFLQSSHPPRGIVQAIIAWWYANNLFFVDFTLVGMGMAFYFLPKLTGKPLVSDGYAMFAFVTLMAFGAWCGIPSGAPVPAWLPSASTFAALLSVVPVLALAIITWETLRGTPFRISGGPLCFTKIGAFSFVISALLYLNEFLPRHSEVVDLTWFTFAVTQWQALGFLGMIVCGAIYYIVPRMMEKELPFAGLAPLSFYLFAGGGLLFVVPLVIGGVEQGLKLQDPTVPFLDVSKATLLFFRISTTGQLLMLLGALCLALNIFVMTIQWKFGLLKALKTAVFAPLTTPEVKS
jgi:cytochrome c oxidase cbb3-type subunit 1